MAPYSIPAPSRTHLAYSHDIITVLHNQSIIQNTDAPIVARSLIAKAIQLSERQTARHMAMMEDAGIITSTENRGFDNEGRRQPARRRLNHGRAIVYERNARNARRLAMRYYWRSDQWDTAKFAAYAAKRRSKQRRTAPIITQCQHAPLTVTAEQAAEYWALIKADAAKRTWMTLNDCVKSAFNSKWSKLDATDRETMFQALQLAAATYDSFDIDMLIITNMSKPPVPEAALDDVSKRSFGAKRE